MKKKQISPEMLRTARVVIFSLIGVVILTRLFQVVSFDTIFQTLLTGDVKIVLYSLVIAAGAQVVNGYRIKLCLKENSNAIKITSIAAVHQMMINMLPFRSGEIAFVVLARKYLWCTTEESVTVLGAIRFGDILAGSLFCLITLALAFIKYSSIVIPLTVLLIGMLIIGVAGYLFVLKSDGVLEKIIHSQDHGSSAIKKSVIKILVLLVKSTTGVREKLGLRLFSLTLLYWLLNYLQAWGFFCALYKIDSIRYLILFTISTLASIVPIHGFLNIGTNEGIHVLTVIKLGLDMRIALSTAIGCHILTLFSTVLFGGIGWIILLLQSSTVKHGSQASPVVKCGSDCIKASTLANNTAEEQPDVN